MRSIEQEGARVVMLGSFNPGIFQPRWLGSLGLIRPAEAESATISIIQEQVCDFKTEWFHMQALQNKFTMYSLDATHYEPVRDLLAGIFELLKYTPVKRMLIGRFFHYRMESTDAWHRVGDILAPKSFWVPLMDGPGLSSMKIVGKRTGGEGGALAVRVEPSRMITPNGVFIDVDEDFEAPISSVENAEWVPPLLNRHWDMIMNYALNLTEGILKGVDGCA